MLKHLNIIFYLIILGICFPRILLIGDDSSHPLEELSLHFDGFSSTISVIYANECNVSDTLNILYSDDIVFWEKNSPFTTNEKQYIIDFQLNNGVFVLFGKNIYDDPYFFIEQFGGSFLRERSENNIFVDNELINFEIESNVSELQLIGNSGNILSIYGTNLIASLYKENNFFLNGFWLEELTTEGRQTYINYLFGKINNENIILEIENIIADNDSEIDIQLFLKNENSISNIELIINIEHDYLSEYEISSTNRSIGLDWNILDLPFGNIKITADYNSGFILEGEGPIAIIHTYSQNNAVGKIALQILESTILDSSENELIIENVNGEIDFNFSLPVIFFTEHNPIKLGESGIIKMYLQNEMDISGFQFCLEFDSNELLFVRADPTNRVPEDWWVGQFGQGDNDKIQIASLGFSILSPGDGPILEIELLSIGETPTLTTIHFCDSYLLNENSQSLENQVFSADVNIFSPQIYITPHIIHSANFTDIIFSYYSEIGFSGFQLDLMVGNENYQQLIGYFGSYITGNTIDGTSCRIIGFTQNEEINFPENGSLFLVSFNYLNSLENNVEYDNLMFSDNQGEIIYSDLDSTIISNYTIGDIDGNGELDIKDLLIIKSYITFEIELGLAQKENSDIDFNGSVDILDLAILLNNLTR